MPEMTGLDTIKAIGAKMPFYFNDCHIQSMLCRRHELNVVDYLLKPIPFRGSFKQFKRPGTLYQRHPILVMRTLLLMMTIYMSKLRLKESC